MLGISSRITNVCSCARVVVGIAATLLMLTTIVRADNLSVDCSGATPGAFTSIQAAINSLPLNVTTEPHTITVTGTCGTVSIDSRQRITIEAPVGQTATITSVNPNAVLVGVGRSRSIVLRRLVLSGGRIGLFLNQNAEVTVEDVTVEQSVRGILMFQNSSLATSGNTRVRNNTGSGIELDEGSVIVLGPATVENNGGAAVILGNGSRATIVNTTMTGNRSGVSVLNGSAVRFAIQNTIQNNGFSGVTIRGGSAGQFDGTTIIEGHPQNGLAVFAAKAEARGILKVRNNGSLSFPLQNGIGVDGGGTLTLTNGAEITGNVGPGILVRGNSALYLSAGVPITVSNNSEEGIRVTRNSLLSIFLPVTIADNPSGSITCDTTSLVTGTLDGLKNINCPRIERENGPPRPGAIVDQGPPSP
jgi:Periplasmic copper-binding protein (NosD)